MRLHTALSLAVIAGMAAGCAEQLARAARPDEGLLPAVVTPITKMNRTLRELPAPEQRVAVAVYGYTDQTGQFKPAEAVQSLSRAVTQGATSVLIKALQDAGDGRWFIVVERERLDNLLKERRIITDMRERYLGEKTINPKALPPLLFAGVLLEGGIIGFDSNTRTGGAGARLLGIGGDIQYREDVVTIYLRAISTKTGEVMVSVVSHKTIISVGVRGSAFKYVALDRILEAEAGITNNEPDQLAIQQAIEKALYALIIEGAARGIWGFADKQFQAAAIAKYDREQLLARATRKTDGEPKTAVAAKDGNAPASANTASAPGNQPGPTAQVPPAQPAAAQGPPAHAQPNQNPPAAKTPPGQPTPQQPLAAAKAAPPPDLPARQAATPPVVPAAGPPAGASPPRVVASNAEAMPDLWNFAMTRAMETPARAPAPKAAPPPPPPPEFPPVPRTEVQAITGGTYGE